MLAVLALKVRAGGCFVVAFSLVSEILKPRAPLALSLGAATAAWLLVAVGLYLVAARVLRNHGRHPAAPDQPGSAAPRTKTRIA